jgi:predicted ATPase
MIAARVLPRRTTTMLIILLVFLGPLVARAALYAAGNDPRSWRTADWSSAGLLPAAAAHKDARVIVFTGAPGAGKTSIIRALAAAGCAVVEEAATDVIALMQAQGVQEPWTAPDFIDRIVALQRRRRIAAAARRAPVRFHDRSVICTQALCTYLERPIPNPLAREIEAVLGEAAFQPRVFFVRNIGFVTPTEARRISYADSLAFEALHQETYRAFGFELLEVAPGPLAERVSFVAASARGQASDSRR